MPSLRVEMTGTRQIVMISFDEVHKFLQDNSPKESITFERVVDYIKSLDQARAASLHKNGVRLFFATLSAGKGIYAPTGFIVCERVMRSKNDGFRFSFHPVANETKLLDAIANVQAPGPCK
eukprot:6110084-Lingulodinium_polyedra.AAC.1